MSGCSEAAAAAKHGKVSATHRQQMIAAARLRAKRFSQKQIAARLDCSQGQVAKFLKEAERAEILDSHPSFNLHKIPQEEWAEIEARFFSDQDITDDLRHLAPANVHFNARVLTGEYDDFIREAADYIGHLLRRSRRIGLMWGRTVHRLVQILQAGLDRIDRTALRHVECVPLCGDPVFLMNQQQMDFSASWLAFTLEKALTGNERKPFHCLVGVPAYLSRKLRGAYATGVPSLPIPQADKDSVSLIQRSFIEDIPGYVAIFGRSENPGLRLIDDVDTVITGVGIVVTGEERPGHRVGDLIEERVQQEAREGITRESLAPLIYGDLGGILLEKPGLKPKQKELVKELNRGWTGVQLHHLHRIAHGTRAHDKAGPPGIILIAAGPPRGELICEVIRLGLVNTLLVDSGLGVRLKKLAGKS